MFTDAVLHEAIAELREHADTPPKKILLEFLEANLDAFKTYQPRMVVLEDGRSWVRKQRKAAQEQSKDAS